MDVDELIRGVPLFAALDDESVTALRAAATPIKIKRGDALFREGESGNQLYIIMSGKMKICRTAPDGRETLLVIAGPRDTVGETAVFDPGPRITSAYALTEAKMLELHHDQLWDWMNDHPGVAQALLQTLARRLKVGAETMSNLVFLDVPNRVAKALLDLASRFGVPAADGGIHVPHDLTQEELAQLVGASRETVNKILGEFTARGWIKVKGRAVVLLRPDRLRRRISAGDPKDPTSRPSTDVSRAVRTL